MSNSPSPCVFVSKAMLEQTLAKPSAPGKRMLEPFFSFAVANSLPFKILEDQEVSNQAEVHRYEGDLWLCLEGRVKFITDGELIDPKNRLLADGILDERELYAEAIRDGKECILEVGDWLWIPAGQPHQHICDAQARLIIIKIPQS